LSSNAPPRRHHSNSEAGLLRNVVHFFVYHLLLKRRRTAVTRIVGFHLVVPPTVFHPRYFLSTKIFAKFISSLNLEGCHVADVGTGTGILGLAAARSGAASVLAIDLNPSAACVAINNAHANGFANRLTALCCNLFNSVAEGYLFDAIVTNPPYLAREPKDLADRACAAGPHYRDISSLFKEAAKRLKPSGAVYIILSQHSDRDTLASFMQEAGLRIARIQERSAFIERLFIYELRHERELELAARQ
jgi:methylase of polypeptide subunit release factors